MSSAYLKVCTLSHADLIKSVLKIKSETIHHPGDIQYHSSAHLIINCQYWHTAGDQQETLYSQIKKHGTFIGFSLSIKVLGTVALKADVKPINKTLAKPDVCSR